MSKFSPSISDYRSLKPNDKALPRIQNITNESDLDDECHLWERWITIVQTDSDFDKIRCPRCLPEQCGSECVWVDSALGFVSQRIRLAADVLDALKGVVFPMSSLNLIKIRFAFKQAINLEEDIDDLAERLAEFRKVRGHETAPTVWEILSKTFTNDLLAERNPSAHEPKSDDHTTFGTEYQEDSDGDRGNRDKQNPAQPNTAADPRPKSSINNRYTPVPHTCPYQGCNVRTKAGYMRRHFLSHTRKNGNFRCLHCPFHSTTLQALRKHGQSHHRLSVKGPVMAEMIAVNSKRLETVFRAAQGLTGNDFPEKLWL